MGVTYSSTATVTYERIASATVTSTGSKSIDITSIPQTFTHLIVVCSTRRNAPGAGARGVDIYFNGDSGTNQYGYDGWYLEQGGVSAASNRYSSAQGGSAFDGNTPGTTYNFYINDYTNTNFKRNMRTEQGRFQGGSMANYVYNNTWNSTSALNRIQINEPFEGFVAGDEVTIYGIKEA
jgi:hypothetical protein